MNSTDRSPAARPAEDFGRRTQELTPLPARNLDFLRAIAVSCVLADHFATTWRVSPRVFDSWAIGQLGVLIFFVHTALVLMSSLEREGTLRPDWIRAFYIRRALRIYPLVIATIGLVVSLRIPWRVPVVGTIGETVAINARTLLSNLTLTQNLTGAHNVLGVLWSLPIEVQMYVLLPFCFLVARSRSRDVALMLLFFVAVFFLVRSGVVPFRDHLWAVAYGPCFAGGLVAYHLLQRGLRPRLPAWVWPLALVGVGALYLALRPTPEHPERAWLPCLCLGAIIPLIADARSSWLATVAHKICEMSYGIYLLNVPVLWFSFIVLKQAPLWLQWTTCATLLVALPTLSYRYIERPSILFGRALVRKRLAVASTSEGSSSPWSTGGAPPLVVKVPDAVVR